MPKILVVEDEPLLREEIMEALDFAGYDVVTAPNGVQGLKMAEEHLPDLIISDITMPVMDGHGLLRAVRENNLIAHIPFIFLTAKSTYSDLRAGMGLGADDYLVKPFAFTELIKAVETRFARQASTTHHLEEQLDLLRQSVVSSIPHEFRTPLAGIMGYTDLLAMNFTTYPPEQTLQMLQTIQRFTNRLYHLVENYLLFNQLEVIGLSPERLELIQKYKGVKPSLVTDVLPKAAKQRATFHQRPDDLHLDIAPAALRVIEEDCQKIMGELIDNAFKFSQKGDPVVVKGTCDDQYYRLTITDKGRGMRPDQIRNLTGMIQLERKLYEQQGAGLGFTIARRLTDIYGGTLQVESQPYQGCTVTLQLLLFNG